MDRSDWRRITKALTERDCMTKEGPVRTKTQLEEQYGQVWNSFTLARDFEIEAFTESCVVVVSREDGRRGTVQFQWHPRFYWGFKEA